MQPADLTGALTDAMRPTEADLIAVRSLVIQTLATNSSATLGDLQREVCEQVLEIPHGNAGQLIEGDNYNPARAEDLRRHPVVAHHLAEFLVAEVLAQLQSESAVIAVTGDIYQESSKVQLMVHRGNMTGPLEVKYPYAPALVSGSRWRLSRPGAAVDEVINLGTMTVGINDLLTTRGVRCIEEAVRAYRAGLWLASATLTAAASEAAWFQIGREIIPATRAISRDIADGENAAKVMTTVATEMRSQKLAAASTIDDLSAHAAYLRDIRNYGIHPASVEDEDREASFTQAGVLVLLMASRRYFVRLESVRRSWFDRSVA